MATRRCDYKLGDEFFREACGNRGVPDFDTFATAANALCDSFCTLRENAFSLHWVGRYYWMNPPYEDDFIYRVLAKCTADFEDDPTNTRYLLCLPKWEEAYWYPLTKQFQVVHEFRAERDIFTTPVETALASQTTRAEPGRVWAGPTRWGVVVLYKDATINTAPVVDVLMHRRLGHCGGSVLRSLVESGAALGKGVTEELKRVHATGASAHMSCSANCKVCLLAKQDAMPAPRGKHETVGSVGELMFWDWHGPLPRAYDGSTGIHGCLDDFSKTFITFCDKSSTTAPMRLQQVDAWVRKTRAKLHGPQSVLGPRTVQADNAKVYTGEGFNKEADTLGISVRYSAPYTHTNQAMIERRWRTLMSITRALLMEANLDKEFWPLAVQHATWLMKRIPTKGNPEQKSRYHA